MSVVSNASPLIGLARIGELELLQQLYGELVIPEAVAREVVLEGAGLPAADQVRKAAWIKTQTISNSQLVRVLHENLISYTCALYRMKAKREGGDSTYCAAAAEHL